VSQSTNARCYTCVIRIVQSVHQCHVAILQRRDHWLGGGVALRRADDSVKNTLWLMERADDHNLALRFATAGGDIPGYALRHQSQCVRRAGEGNTALLHHREMLAGLCDILHNVRREDHDAVDTQFRQQVADR
jgi:hypothetical protein